MSTTKAENQEAISPEEALQAFSLSTKAEFDSFRKKLASLKGKEPQLLHIEGGSIEERTSFAYYYAALHMCEEQKSFAQSIHLPNERHIEAPIGAPLESFATELEKLSVPCLQCPTCIQVGANMHADFFVFDGRESSIQVDDTRSLKALLGEAPRFAPKRIILVLEAHELTTAAANSLLKLLEDPNKYTRFLFTMPQRERLLPTLISRGFVLTLPWLDPARERNKEEQEWEELLAQFFRNGSGLLDKISAKGTMDMVLAQKLLLIVQKNLSHAIANRNNGGKDDDCNLCKILQRLPQEAMPEADKLISQTQEATQYLSNPTYLITAFLTSFYNLLH